MGSLEQFEQCCSVAMLVLATLLLLAATLHNAPAVAEESDVEAVEPRDDHETAADIEMSDKTIRTKDPLAKLCRKCAKPKYAKKHSSECDAAVCFGFAASMEKDRKNASGDCNKCSREKFRARHDFCNKCPKLKNQKRAKNNEKKKSKHAKNKSPVKLPKPVFAHHQLPQVPQSASTKDTVQLGPLGTFLKEIIQANTFVDA